MASQPSGVPAPPDHGTRVSGGDGQRLKRALDSLDGVTKLIGAMAWPIVALISICLLLEPIKAGFGAISTFSVKGIGLELSASLEARRATALSVFDAANAQKVSREGVVPASLAVSHKGSDKLLSEATVARLAKSLILWVDDNPKNNPLERRAFEALGVRFTNVTSTQSAMDVLLSMDHASSSIYNIIISDLSRKNDGCDKVANEDACKKCEPFQLLEWVRKEKGLQFRPAFIFYTSQDKAPTCRRYATKLGAFGMTGEPGELLELVSRIAADQAKQVAPR